MRNARPFLLPLALLASAARSQAGQASLSLEDCIRLALASDSSVVVAKKQEEIAALGVTQSKAALLPQARLSGGFTYNSPGQGTLQSYAALNGVREYAALVTASEEIDTSGRLRAASARAAADRRASVAGLRIAERDLRRQVAGSYYRALLAKQLVTVSEDALAESEAFEARTRLHFDQGEAARADVVKASGQTVFLKQSLIQAQLDLELANHELLSYWTTDLTGPVELQGSLEEGLKEPEEGSSEGGLFLRRPEFALMEAQHEGLLAESRRAKDERRPQASVSLQYGLDSLRLDWTERGWAAFASLDVPLFDWFKGRSAARQFELEAAQVSTTRHAAERALAREYEDALSRVRLLYSEIEATRSQVKLSQENLHMSRIRYDGGEGPALDVVAAETQLAQARTNLYQALARYLESRADLDVASGR